MVGKRKEPQAGVLRPISSVELHLHQRRTHLENRVHAARMQLSALSPAGTATWVDVPASLAPGRPSLNGSRFGVRAARGMSELECEEIAAKWLNPHCVQGPAKPSYIHSPVYSLQTSGRGVLLYIGPGEEAGGRVFC